MLSEKDYAVVAEMARTGMSLEVLKKCFPKLEPQDIEEVFRNETRVRDYEPEEEFTMKCNCS